MSEYQWPKIFVDPDQCEPPKKHRRELAIAHACHGWGLCYAGAEVPKKFGGGMVKLADWAESTEAFTPDVVKSLAGELKIA